MNQKSLVITPSLIRESANANVAPTLPYSKSICNRVLMIQALSWMRDGQISSSLGSSTFSLWCERLGRGLELIKPESDDICDDTKATLGWLVKADKLDGQTIDVGAAGTAMRFSTALLSMLHCDCVLTGSARMKERPIGLLVDALRTLGADIEYVEREGFPPLHIRGGKLHGGTIQMQGAVSSQFISALLMIGPMLDCGLHLKLEGEIVSRPYIDMTLREMRAAHAIAEWTSEREIAVSPVPYSQSHSQFIERDWTAASYWYETLALGGEKGSTLRLHGLMDDSSQGDRRVADIFSHLGIQTRFLQDDRPTVELTYTGRIADRLDWDFVETPDLAQTLVVTCCMMGVAFHFTGLQSLKIKETDRIAALQTELAKLGFSIDANEREMWWDGAKTTKATDYVPSIDTYKDHRMAMAFAPCALRLAGIIINEPDVVSKSYPNFWEQLNDIKL